MKLSLAHARVRWLFGLGVLLLVAMLSWEAGKHGWADRLANSSEPEDWRQAAELEPGNAAHWYRLGRFRQSDFVQGDLDQAILHYQRAIAVSPRSASYWSELAGAFALRGELARARHAFEQARSSDPISPQVAWSYGNFLLRQGQLSEGFAEIRRALSVDPRPTPFAVSLAWRASGDVERLLEEVLPPASSYYFQALDYFLSQQELTAALTTWNRLLGLGEPVELPRALPLVGRLIQQERLDEARRVWDQALRASGWEVEPGDPSLVWNGGFERELARGGFGWRWRPAPGATIDFDSTTYWTGARSLRIVFDGSTNVDFQHLVQYLAVVPGSRYRFRAFLRTEGISTDSGVRVRLFDPQRPAALDILTRALLGDQPWSRQEAEFTTGSETRLLAIALRRAASRKFDNKIRGTVWVDDVSLTPLGNPGTPRSP